MAGFLTWQMPAVPTRIVIYYIYLLQPRRFTYTHLVLLLSREEQRTFFMEVQVSTYVAFFFLSKPLSLMMIDALCPHCKCLLMLINESLLKQIPNHKSQLVENGQTLDTQNISKIEQIVSLFFFLVREHNMTLCQVTIRSTIKYSDLLQHLTRRNNHKTFSIYIKSQMQHLTMTIIRFLQ